MKFGEAYITLSNSESGENIHVREVVPINWEKVWDEVMKHYSYNPDFADLIQKTVEKSLRGEL